VPSVATRDDVVDRLGMSADRVRVVPWGVPLETAAPLAPDAVASVRHRHRLPARYVLYVGTIDRRKDYRGLLDAMSMLDADVALVLAGSVIEGRTDFVDLLPASSLRDRVRVLGYVPDADLRALYAGAEVFVYPSFIEGFGLPVLEAMACGTPVVTYRTTSLPEVAGDAAILLDPPVTAVALAKALREVMDDAGLRRRLAERGRAHAAGFDWRTTARLTAAVYASAGGRR
jgi:glycosyltransferase involved in cell wall biosynthesis